jgi:transporter family-2 protein
VTGQPHAGFVWLAAMMFVAGLGIPVFAAFNSALGQQLGGPIAATATTFAVGFAISIILLAITGFPAREAITFERPWIWFGAVFMLFYAISVSFAAPRIGIGNAIFFVLLGQLVAAAIIDHFALFGAIPTPLTARRIIGIGAMTAGVYLARKPM